MLLIRCKFKCYSRHYIIYSDLNNVRNFCCYKCSLTMFEFFATSYAASMFSPTKHTFLLTLLDPRKHSSADFNNVKYIFVRIQFVTID